MNIKKEILQNELRRYEIISEEALEEYLNICLVCKESTDIYVEKHHILPKSMFPEYSKSSWNLVVLDRETHINAHRKLYNMYSDYRMKISLFFMLSMDKKGYEASQLTGHIRYGDDNVSKRLDVREKISKSKIGVPRPDLVGKKYFGADKSVIEKGIQSMTKKLKGTIIVKDIEGNRFRVSINDPRYISKELIPFNIGLERKSHALQDPEKLKRQMETKAETLNKFKVFSLEDMTDYLLEQHNKGSVIFGKTKLFSNNHARFINLSGLDHNLVLKSIVQRLEKDA